MVLAVGCLPRFSRCIEGFRCTDGDGVCAGPDRVKDDLMLRISDTPPMLANDIDTLADITGQWWIAHTRSRFEKTFAWDLRSRGINYFLPLVERVRVSGGRKRRVVMPLFSSYVFFCGGESVRYEALATNRLCQVIKVHEQSKLVGELLAIEKALAGKVQLDPYPFAAVGRRCRITAGVFRGVEGVVIQRNGVTRLVLEVSMLGQGAALEIEADLIEPVN